MHLLWGWFFGFPSGSDLLHWSPWNLAGVSRPLVHSPLQNFALISLAFSEQIKTNPWGLTQIKPWLSKYLREVYKFHFFVCRPYILLVLHMFWGSFIWFVECILIWNKYSAFYKSFLLLMHVLMSGTMCNFVRGWEVLCLTFSGTLLIAA